MADETTETVTEPGTGGETSEPAAFDFADHYEGEDLGYIQNKGWKTTQDVVSAYKEFEKFRGVPADEIMRHPGEDAEKWQELYTRLGRPETAEGYEVEIPEGVETDQKMMDWFKGVGHEAGLSNGQLNKVIGAWNTLMPEQAAAMEQQMAEKATADMVELRDRWGKDQLETRLNQVSQLLTQSGMTEEQLGVVQSAMGNAAIIEVFWPIVQKIGEVGPGDAPPSGGVGGITKEEAAFEKDKLMEELSNDTERWAQYAKSIGPDYAKMERLLTIIASD